MKKILFLIPFIGIYSSLFAQAPTVTEVNATQTEGTKEVNINFQISGKVDEYGGDSMVYMEVWYKTSASETTWQKVQTLKHDVGYGFEGIPANSVDDGLGNLTPISFHAGMYGTNSMPKWMIWDAGVDAPGVQTDDAQIRIVAFYPKQGEFGGLKPEDQQVSGWDGNGDFGVGESASGN